MGKNAYFNNATTTYPKPEQVYSFMDSYNRNNYESFGRGSSGTLTTKGIIFETRSLLQKLFNCSNKKVVLLSSATESFNVVLQGLNIEDGYNIYVSPFEHNAVTRTLYHLENKYKINIRELSVNKENLTYNLDKISSDFNSYPPNIVIINHGSNVCGVVAPIKEICSLSKKYDSVNIIDMCQTAGIIDIDLSGDIYDFNIFAGHKNLYAPLGIGGFICKSNSDLKPLLFGGTGIDSASLTLPETIPEKFEVGSQNTLAIAGLYASLKWLLDISVENIYKKEIENKSKLLKLLSNYSNIKIIDFGQYENQSLGVVSCVFDSYSSDEIGKVLSQNNVEVRTGLHCSPSAHKFLNTFPSGTVRFSVGYFNTDQDFEILESALDYIEENS